MKKTIIIIGCVVVALIIGGMVYYFIQQQKKIDEMSEQFNIQKEELEEEYMNLVIEYSDFQIDSNNDSLLYLLDAEKAKVQRLLEELRTVKSTNIRQINALKKELETVRGVMRSYVIQIDSLNRINEVLKQENAEVSRKYQQASQTVSRLSQERETLTEKVVMASKLNATGISATPVNKKGKAEKKVKNIQQINICFTITKNITAPTGEKAIYVRIMKPDDDILIKSPGNVFQYENRNINYSMKKVIEYDGEDTNVCLYWQVEEFLYPGTYRADIFADGYLIGSRSFSIDK
ncbi:MAG: hypothetical protein LUG18_14365 [Candidatus Azobacteroides sp.]|nr:hypothetical protein [Candidatus Azobacteroides sp.]